MFSSEETNGDLKDKSLSECFDEAYKSFEDISNSNSPTNSSEVQYKVKKCMNLLEDITRMVSVAGIFSTNELINEVPTNNLKFMLLPSLLGMLMLNLTNGNRKDIVSTAEVYFKDFLQRCKDYGLTDVEILAVENDEDSSLPITLNPPTEHACLDGLESLMSMARTRASKIKQYHRQKEMESRLKSLKEQTESILGHDHDIGENEDVKRKYHLCLIEWHINKAIEELDCLQSEKMILARKLSVTSSDDIDHNKPSKRPPPSSAYKCKPLQPVIITRDEMQRKVFGAGYPSLPTMTVEQLYEQRIKDGTWTNANTNSSLQDMAKSEELKVAKEEEEEISKEQSIENDDPQLLERMRRMDEYKDTHKRGWGNRYNRS